ncbi:hypothetical protein D9757_001215 [Collybiopsis confluens]|uniref:F-box domain-containing protein n=1 Tax=Collybiopsis confluens TaxID=2823264 RepID=A0A8H5I0Q7_9AGAR|nr:hypothetical protein D9757_001215 [Collybiopsis confluens]
MTEHDSLLCSECSSKIDNLAEPPFDTEFYQAIYSRARNGDNLPASPVEFGQLDAFLAEVPGKLAAVDKRLAEAEQLVITLRKSRDDLLAHSDAAKYMVSSPIRQLPLEVLSEIFTFCCWQDGFNLILTREAGGPSTFFCQAMLLSHVSSFWRNTIIHSRPDLWSSFKMSSTFFKSKPDAFRILMKYISCSSHHTLDFHYEIHPESRIRVAASDPAIKVLFDNLTRWRRATLISSIPLHSIHPWSSWTSLSTNAGPLNFSRLEYLQVSPSIPSNLFLSFSSFPRLQTISGLDWSDHHDFSFPGCSHISEIKVSRMIGRSLAHLLRFLPALKRLTVLNFTCSESREDNKWLQDTPFHTSLISELTVGPLSHWNIFDMEVWNFLRVPDLVKLVIFVGKNHMESVLGPISSLLFHSECHLQTLELTFDQVELDHSPQQMLVDFIAPFSSLINLSVTFYAPKDMLALMHHLTLVHDSSVPNVRNLKLSSNLPPEDSECPVITSKIWQLVEARSQVPGFSVDVHSAGVPASDFQIMGMDSPYVTSLSAASPLPNYLTDGDTVRRKPTLSMDFSHSMLGATSI